MELILAILLGTFFGFVLQRVGAADPDKIIGMLSLKDLHLMKTILTAIGFSSTLLFLGIQFGLVDPGHLSIKSMYLGVIIGGAILGFGWALSGYCPGTGIVAAGSGRKDGLYFILGGLVGAGLFTLMFSTLEKTSLFEKILHDKSTLVTTGSSYAFLDTVWSPYLAVLIGVLFMLIAKRMPEKIR